MVPFLVVSLLGSLKYIKAGFVDPDTPEKFLKTHAFTVGDHREFELVGIVFPLR